MSHSAPCILLIIPATNTTMERELHTYCPEVNRLLVARVPPYRSDVAVADTFAAIAPFAGDRIDVVVHGCTSAGFIGGTQAEEDMTTAISDRIGAPIVSTAQAMLASLRAANITRPEIVTPYSRATNQALTAYLWAAGIAVARLESFLCKGAEEMGRVTADQVFAKAVETATPAGDGLFVACTQLPTYEVLPRLRDRLCRPVSSSVEATALMARQALARVSVR